MARRTAVRAVALALLMFTALGAGCLGGDDAGKKGAITLIWGADATAGKVVQTMVPNSQNQTQDLVEAEFSIDFNQTYSSAGDIVTFFVDKGNGDDVVEVSASDMSIVTFSYAAHGIYRAILGANDSADNTETTEILLRVEYELFYDNTQSTSDPYPVWFDCAPGSSEATPRRVDLISNVTNPNSALPVFGGPSTVTWSVRDPSDSEVAASTEEVADGGEAQFGWGEGDPLSGGWRMDIDVEGDEIETETWLEIVYETLETPVPEPPTQQE